MKKRDGEPPDDSSAKPDVTAAPAEAESEPGAEARPSQLEQIRAALDEPSRPTDLPEPPAPAAESTPGSVAELAEAPEAPTEVEPESAEPAEPAEPSEPSEPAEAPTTPEPVSSAVPVLAPAPSGWVPPPNQPPAVAAPMVSGRPAARPTGTGLAAGIVLVVVGVFFLIVRLTNADLGTYGWPLYVVIPGLTLLVVGFVSLGRGAVIPGGIVTITGLVLAYQSISNDWASWAYAWALVVPGGVGVGIFLQGLRDRDPKQLRQGRTLMFWSLLIFMIGFVFFESILNISGIDYGIFGRAALPALLIVLGVTLLARSVQRGRLERR